jgi:hypothetical protein
MTSGKTPSSALRGLWDLEQIGRLKGRPEVADARSRLAALR